MLPATLNLDRIVQRLIRRERCFQRLQILGDHRIAVLSGDLDSRVADGTAFLVPIQFVERLGEGEIGC